MAQWIDHQTSYLVVAGSSPAGGNFYVNLFFLHSTGTVTINKI